jgi:hypothetical protein
MARRQAIGSLAVVFLAVFITTWLPWVAASPTATAQASRAPAVPVFANCNYDHAGQQSPELRASRRCPGSPRVLATRPSAPAAVETRLESPSRFAAEAGDAGGTTATKTFQTYTKVNPDTGEVYAGRTSGTGSPLENLASRDAGHAYNDEGFGPAQLDQSSESYAAIRGREQQLIEYYQDLGVSANKINGISPTNPNLDWYLESSLGEFGPVP